MKFTQRVKNGWNAFADNKNSFTKDIGYGSSSNFSSGTKRIVSRNTIANTIFNRIALDVSMVDILHVKTDSRTDNQTKMDSPLQRCLSYEANIDQTGKAFIHDLVYSLLDEGVIAVVPVDTTISPTKSSGFDINSMRVGKITQWYPKHVRVSLYNESTGQYEEITLAKKAVAIIENPLYAVVNGDNGLLNRLLRKMALADDEDERATNGSLNMIVQFPYVVKGDVRRKQAEERLKSLEEQLKNNRRGIAYIDATEKVTQLNRPITNNLQDEIKYLTEQFYNAIGLTQNVFNGTASESELRGYYTRSVDVIIQAILAEFNRKFLTRTAITQGQLLVAYRDPFDLVPVEQLASIADTFSRNAILTLNEIRKIIGYGPNASPAADELSNKNIADVNQTSAGSSTSMSSPV